MRGSVLTIILLASSFAFANTCPDTSKAGVKACLKEISAGIDEGNLPNDVFASTKSAAKGALLQVLSDEYKKPVEVKRALVLAAAAVGVIAQYNDEPILYYYAVSTDGEISEIAEVNIADRSEPQDRGALYFRDKSAPKKLIEFAEEF